MTKAIEKSMRDALDPILKENKPSILTELKMDIIKFENRPLVFTGITASRCEETSEEVIINANFRLNSNTNISIIAKTYLKNTNIKVKDLDICGTFKIRLCYLTTEWPTFKCIKICFSESPEIDFNLDCVVTLTEIPYLSSEIDNLIKNLVVKYFT